MGKKRSRATYSSKSERRSISKSTVKAVRREACPITKELNKIRAWKKGQNPWITVANSNTKETAKKFIRVRANALLGDPKGRRQIVSEESNDLF